MPQTDDHGVANVSDPRPVLLWLAEGDESHVKASLAEAGAFLHVSPEEVAAAIASGEPLQGWFVDWEAVST